MIQEQRSSAVRQKTLNRTKQMLELKDPVLKNPVESFNSRLDQMDGRKNQ